jgi:hypothetical protein
MNDPLKEVKACGICKIVTDDGVNTAPCHCLKKTDPLKELEEYIRPFYEEWKEERKSRGKMELNDIDMLWPMLHGQVLTLEFVLAKIAEMRENKDV